MFEKAWLASLLVFLGCASGPRESPPSELLGPFVHANLAVYVVRGEASDPREYVTLDEGLRNGSVFLRETGEGEVDTLVVENRSDRWLFLHAADIVTGGKQDRTIAADVVVPPRSAAVDIAAFCVERGRWSGDSPEFAESKAIASGPLKLRIQRDRDQTGVWDEVAKQSEDVAYLAGDPPLAALSSTGTYDAVVEHPAIRSKESAYVEALLPKIEAAPDAVGLIAAIGGELTAADVYGSPELFRSLAAKLLASYAREAALAPEGKKTTPGASAAVRFLSEAEGQPDRDEQLSESMVRKTRESESTVVFEYHDGVSGLLHRSIVTKK
ncbi:MAG TPA: DUF6569 family protein [Vicinamibacteria bacterium]|nr:DUF6569 family protein [Vicinamibacteria bacterium]